MFAAQRAIAPQAAGDPSPPTATARCRPALRGGSCACSAAARWHRARSAPD